MGANTEMQDIALNVGRNFQHEGCQMLEEVPQRCHEVFVLGDTCYPPALACPLQGLDKQLCSLPWALTLRNALQVNG